MKVFVLSLLLFIAIMASAQFSITPGAQVFLKGNALLTLENIDLINNGDFEAGNGLTSFTGKSGASIGGSRSFQFFELEINKTGNSPVALNQSVSATHRIIFTSGFLDLNGFNMDLGTSAFLDGEQENSRVIGAIGGVVSVSTMLNAPVAANPGNLGAVISSGANLGNVIIRRGHQSLSTVSAGGGSILRFYDIVPANNSGLDAALRINYFDGELNQLDEATLELLQSNGPSTFTSLGFTSRDASLNFVEKTGLDSFARMTLANPVNALPIVFTGFSATCAGQTLLLTWETGQEENSSHFNIEKSADGTHWTTIGSIPAAGNSSNKRTYNYTDDDPGNSNDYRIAETDLGGGQQYSQIIRSSCGIPDGFSIWPNPARDLVFVHIDAASASAAVIRIFDAKGDLIKIQQAALLQGANQIGIELGSLAGGLYQVSVDWNNGQTRKTVEVLHIK